MKSLLKLLEITIFCCGVVALAGAQTLASPTVPATNPDPVGQLTKALNVTLHQATGGAGAILR
jgi:hypothetical protein